MDTQDIPEDNDQIEMTPILEEIIAHEFQHRGVDWREVWKGGDAALEEAFEKYRRHFEGQIQALAETEPELARLFTSTDETANPLGLFGMHGLVGASSSKTFPDDPSIIPVWGWQKSRAEKYMSAKGSRVKTDICAIMAGFQSMEKKSDEEIANILYDMGILAFSKEGVDAAISYIEKNRNRVWANRRLLVVAATKAALMCRFAPGAAFFTVIMLMMIPILIFCCMSAIGTYIIINDTDAPLTMAEIVFSHGKCRAGFTSTNDLAKVVPTIPAKAVFHIEEGQEEIVFAGFLCVSKRSAALIGTRGAMRMAPIPGGAVKPMLGWEVPLKHDNKVLVDLNAKTKLDDFSNRTQHQGVQDSTSTTSDGGVTRTFTAHLNSQKGGHTYAFYSMR